MPSSPKIPKKKILDTALNILRRNGYGAVNIKAIAEALNSSTQPVSWQFGNMENFRIALTQTALEYAIEKTKPPESISAFAAFREIGRRYLDLAFDEPRLFRFVFLGEGGRRDFGMFSMLDSDRNEHLLNPMTSDFGISRAEAENFMRTMVIYTFGLCTLASMGEIKLPRAEAHRRHLEIGITYLAALGVQRSVIEKMLNLEC